MGSIRQQERTAKQKYKVRVTLFFYTYSKRIENENFFKKRRSNVTVRSQYTHTHGFARHVCNEKRRENRKTTHPCQRSMNTSSSSRRARADYIVLLDNDGLARLTVEPELFVRHIKLSYKTKQNKIAKKFLS